MNGIYRYNDGLASFYLIISLLAIHQVCQELSTITSNELSSQLNDVQIES